MQHREKVFVFVVCGAQEHIDTLHYSLAALAARTRRPVWVVTDSSRNEVPVSHPHIIDIRTPEHYDHHQASIYLKTGLHRFLPAGPLYCYLDTDVVAVRDGVDEIFDQYVSPITFAPDHCVADQFSPSAVRCGCAEKFNAWEKELKELFLVYKDLIRQPEDAEKKERLLKYLEEARKDKLKYAVLSLRFNAARKIFKLDQDTFLNKKEHYWHDRTGAPILYENPVLSSVEMIERTTPYRCEADRGGIWTRDGLDVFDARCTHLIEAIRQVFNIEVSDPQWQHWNGGVFLFDDTSRDFLKSWHDKTMKIFDLPGWKTRDQGTLIATAWEYGLQHHPMLSRRYNLIADYMHRNIDHLGDLVFRLKKEQAEIRPVLAHIYHHWADKRWDVWQAVERATAIEVDPDSQTINGLWIGSTLSALELLTIRSFLSFGYRYKLWLYDPLQTPLPDGVIIGDANEIIPRERVFSYRHKNAYGHGQGSYAGFSDIFRYKLLYDKGGWWADMDVTCLRPLDFPQAYFFRDHHDLKVVGNVMKCPRHSELMLRCYEEAIEQVTEHNTDWHKPINILNDNITRLDLDKYIVRGVSNQDRWDSTSRYIWTDAELPPQWYFIHWQNEEWRTQNVSRSTFYYRSALGRLLRSYQLAAVPQSRAAELLNTARHSQLLRRFTIFNR